MLTLFFYNFTNGYSGTTLYDSIIMAGWNFFLALPIIVIGMEDIDVRAAARCAALSCVPVRRRC